MTKPPKPRADFPLFPHSNGQWAKKIEGKLHYFGVWSDPEAAEKRFLASRVQKTTPRNALTLESGVELRFIANLFLTELDRRQKTGECGKHYRRAFDSLFERLFRCIDRNTLLHQVNWDDLADDMRSEQGKTLSPLSWKATVTKLKTALRYAQTQKVISSIPDLGVGWEKPSRAAIRRTSKQYKTTYSRDEILSMLSHCQQTSKFAFRAMILLGVNSGMGNHDCASLRWQNVDLERGWVESPRLKTGVRRKAKLWDETIQALRRCSQDSDFVFLSPHRKPWQDRNFSIAFDAIMQSAKCKISGRSFYGLRRTCATIGSECEDQAAVNLVMGHLDESTPAIYRVSISDRRIEKVAKTIRDWLFGESGLNS